jgi:activator of HSP90 ATPase
VKTCLWYDIDLVFLLTIHPSQEYPFKLVQKWRFSSWAENHFSTVTISLEDKDGKTLLSLNHEGIPEDDKEHTEHGWKNNFWVRIRGIFGFGGPQ